VLRDIEDKNGHTPLHFAALEGRYEIAKLLIEKGANLNIVDEFFYLK
jgi:ankyrin repeat protein